MNGPEVSLQATDRLVTSILLEECLGWGVGNRWVLLDLVFVVYILVFYWFCWSVSIVFIAWNNKVTTPRITKLRLQDLAKC